MRPQLQIRPTTPADQDWLLALYGETRVDIQQAPHLTADQKRELVQSQFAAQSAHYQTCFPDADFGIVTYGNTRIGRLDLSRSADEILIMELALGANYRGQGLGSQLLRAVQEEARLTGRHVRLHVEKMNPAIAFYLAHGFAVAGEKPLHWELKWQPASQ